MKSRKMNKLKMTPLMQQGLEDLDWAREAAEVQRHVGKFLGVCQRHVVGVATSEEELFQQAEHKGCRKEEVVVVLVPRTDLHEIPR